MYCERMPRPNISGVKPVKHETTISELAKLMNVLSHQIRYFIALSTEAQALGDFSLPAGDYLSIQRLIQEDDELEQMIEAFCDYATTQSYVITGPLILADAGYRTAISRSAAEICRKCAKMQRTDLQKFTLRGQPS